VAQRTADRRNHLARSNRRSAMLFLLPGAIFFAAIFVYPSLKTIQMSLSEVNADNITQGNWPFVGLKNFIAVFHLQATGTTLGNTVIFLVGSIVPQVVIGLLLAIGFRKSSRLRRIGRALVLLPWLLPSVAVSSIFLFIFYTDGGLMNWVLLALHVTKGPVLWFANPGTALFVIILVNIWIGIPFNFLILQSGLQSLPLEVHEAAAVDGAGWWRELFSITVPMLRESLFAVVMLGLIGTLKVFDFVWIMTGGGPANGTMLPSPLAYQQAFVQFNYGNGSAIIVLTVLLMVVLSLIYVRVTAPRDLTRAGRKAGAAQPAPIAPAVGIAVTLATKAETLETTGGRS
jgi:multiple sugar transport system permease protein